jgi:hypothetical protein
MIIRKLLSSTFAPCVAAGLALPMLIWLGAAMYGLNLQPAVVAGTAAFRLYYLALMLCSLAWLVNAIRAKAYASALAVLGLLLVMLQGVWWHGFRFNAKAALGEGEALTEFYDAEKGAWVKTVTLPLALLKGAEREKGRMVFAIDGREQKVGFNNSFSWMGFRLRAINQQVAPLFIVDSARGGNVDTAYVKLGMAPKESDFFQVGVLPHRFYVSASLHPAAARASGGAWTATQGKLHLRIVRDKLIIFDKDVAMGEAVYFDGHYITYKVGAPWVEVTVEKRQRPYFLIPGLLLLLAGAAGRLRGRMR